MLGLTSFGSKVMALNVSNAASKESAPRERVTSLVSFSPGNVVGIMNSGVKTRGGLSKLFLLFLALPDMTTGERTTFRG